MIRYKDRSPWEIGTPVKPGYYLTLSEVLGQPMEVVAYWDGHAWSAWEDDARREMPMHRLWRDIGLRAGRDPLGADDQTQEDDQ